MENVVKRIIEIDSMERKMISDAEASVSSAEGEISQQKAGIRDEYMKIANEKIEALKALEQQNAEKVALEKEAQLKSQMESINKSFEENKEKWVNELFERIIK